MSAITLIFPMAGRGARFGYAFKPFLRVGEESFIQAAVRPFAKWRAVIRRLLFVYLEEQERAYDVTARLHALFPEIDFEIVRLAAPTRGPAQTLVQAIKQAKVTGAFIACDCDHSIGVDPLFEKILHPTAAACVLPVWPLEGEDLKAWSVAAIAHDDRVAAIAEKQRPEKIAARYAGVIGCYYFSEAALLGRYTDGNPVENLSEVITYLIAKGAGVEAVPIAHAEFFGDPHRLATTLQRRTVG